MGVVLLGKQIFQYLFKGCICQKCLRCVQDQKNYRHVVAAFEMCPSVSWLCRCPNCVGHGSGGLVEVSVFPRSSHMKICIFWIFFLITTNFIISQKNYYALSAACVLIELSFLLHYISIIDPHTISAIRQSMIE